MEKNQLNLTKKLLRLTPTQLEHIKLLASFGILSVQNPWPANRRVLFNLVKKGIVEKSISNLDYKLTKRGTIISVGL